MPPLQPNLIACCNNSPLMTPETPSYMNAYQTAGQANMAESVLEALLSLFIIMISLLMIGHESIKWYTVDIFISCLAFALANILEAYFGIFSTQGLNQLHYYFALWNYVHIRVVTFGAVLEIYRVYKMKSTTNVFSNRKILIHTILNVISQIMCLPHILLIIFPFTPFYYILGAMYNVATLSLYGLSVALCVAVLFSIKRSTNSSEYRRRMTAIILYFIPINIMDFPVFLDCISFVFESETKPALAAEFQAIVLNFRGIMDMLRIPVLAVVTQFASTVYRQAFLRLLIRLHLWNGVGRKISVQNNNIFQTAAGPKMSLFSYVLATAPANGPCRKMTV